MILKILTVLLILVGSCVYGKDVTKCRTKWLGDTEWVDCEDTEPTKPLVEKTNYMSFGLGFPSFISVNLGSRYQKNHQGVDFHLGVGYRFLSISLNYLIYPRPLFQSQFYLGTGIKYMVFKPPNHPRGTIIPTYLLFGYEWPSSGWKRFIQADIGRFYIRHRFRLLIPLNFQLSYGFGF